MEGFRAHAPAAATSATEKDDEMAEKLPPMKLQPLASPPAPPDYGPAFQAEQQRKHEESMRETAARMAVVPTPAPEAKFNWPDTGFTIETEFRGETLHYIEPTRRTSMQWFWTNGYSIVESSIENWTLADGTSQKMTAEERAEVVRRVVDYAKRVQGVTMRVDP